MHLIYDKNCQMRYNDNTVIVTTKKTCVLPIQVTFIFCKSVKRL